IFDEEVGDVIKTQGQGQLKMEINPSGDFNIYGNYEITDGDYLFTLENIINKKFTVAPGSTISFDGDPTEAILDVTAIYKLKASLKDLAIADVDTSGKRVAVDCHLIMRESLSNPTLGFDLDLPTSSENTNSAVKTAINSNNSMNKQVFSLLIISRFVPITDRGGFSAGGAGGSSSTELLSNQLSNWLSQISDDFDVGVNYRAGNEVSSSEVEVALSTQLFNDRVTVETNVGVSGDNANSSGSSNIAGDFNLEYKISKDGKIRTRVYNESNDYNDVNTNNIKYTQGVGLFYTEEFDSFGEFFSKLFSKRKKLQKDDEE
ncbi:MAG: translocation/assembly module TamB domain-containing protein, partial [Flavobacteriales bacterium]|nr:translocation/assembly module TamB domain-containing protein [Flavobacteriales bacterium]